jgi:hypothetical protein
MTNLKKMIGDLFNFYNEKIDLKEIKVGEVTIKYDELVKDSKIYQVIEGVESPLQGGTYVIEGIEITVEEGIITNVKSEEEKVEMKDEENKEEKKEEEEKVGMSLIEETDLRIKNIENKIDEIVGVIGELMEKINGKQKETEENFSKKVKELEENFEKINQSSISKKYNTINKNTGLGDTLKSMF